jgi:4-hydroxybenzoate polyprenyltransferase
MAYKAKRALTWGRTAIAEAGLYAFIGAAARLDVIYFIAGLGTAALFYYLCKVLNSDKQDGVLKNTLIIAARAFSK